MIGSFRSRRAVWIRPWRISLFAIVLGAIAGAGAYGFRVLIAVCHNLLLLGRLSASYDTNLHTPMGLWGIGVAIVPAIAALFVVFVVKHWAPEAKGHGVPEVMDAIHYEGGAIRPIVAAVKSVASAISIGSGGSVGREGPIIQIGAAFGSWAGRLLRVPHWQRITLVAAGGGAGIAATFNTPIGGVLFAVEVLLHEVSVRTLVPVTLATATATFVGRWLFGNHPAFVIPPIHMPAVASIVLLPAYAGLGVICAAAAALFIRGLYWMEDLFEARIRNAYLRHAIGMLGVGITMTILALTSGHYFVEGVGYATILDVLEGAIPAIGMLLALFALKLLTTAWTLGSGASGGIFSPALFMGAVLGGAYGIALDALFPGLHLAPTALALAGMAGVVAGSTGAALTAIVMIFEMTLDYSIVLPMTLTVAVAHGLRQRLVRDSIYTMKLTRRGHVIPGALHATTYLVRPVSGLDLVPTLTLPADASPSLLAKTNEAFVAIVDDDQVIGLLSRARLAARADRVRSAERIGDLVEEVPVTVSWETPLVDALAELRRTQKTHAVVIRHGAVEGVIAQPQIADALVDEMLAVGE
ncbi:MAG TPA: chloride channel protein [Kofleriaceae bacterium]|jgi:CIC family chloride channel protein